MPSVIEFEHFYNHKLDSVLENYNQFIAQAYQAWEDKIDRVPIGMEDKVLGYDNVVKNIPDALKTYYINLLKTQSDEKPSRDKLVNVLILNHHEIIETYKVVPKLENFLKQTLILPVADFIEKYEPQKSTRQKTDIEIDIVSSKSTNRMVISSGEANLKKDSEQMAAKNLINQLELRKLNIQVPLKIPKEDQGSNVPNEQMTLVQLLQNRKKQFDDDIKLMIQSER